jgi:hypothetical protein
MVGHEGNRGAVRVLVFVDHDVIEAPADVVGESTIRDHLCPVEQEVVVIDLLESSAGYVSQSLKAYASGPAWQKDPKIAAFKDAAARGKLPLSLRLPAAT